TPQGFGRLFGCSFLGGRLSFVSDCPHSRDAPGPGCLVARALACLGRSGSRQFRMARVTCRSAADESPLFQEHSFRKVYAVAGSCDFSVLPGCHLRSHLLAQRHWDCPTYGWFSDGDTTALHHVALSPKRPAGGSI